MNRLNDRRGFTLVELIVVIGMLMLLAGAVTTSVAGANRRAKIQQAVTEAQEMTKALLASAHYGRGYSLDAHLAEKQQATESSLHLILGKENMQNGQRGKMPVLFNAASTRSGKILDPCGRPYYVTIRWGTVDTEQDSTDGNITSYVTFPNYNRRPADELNPGNTNQ